MTLSYNPKDFNIFIGIDVSKLSFSFTVRDHDSLCRSKRVPSDHMNLVNYIKNNFPDQKVICAYEAGPTGFGLYDTLTAHHVPCLVIAPTTLLKKAVERVKNDRIDSKKLADQLKNGDLKSIHIPQGHFRQLRNLIKSYSHYVDTRRSIKRRIKSLLLLAGLPDGDESLLQNWSSIHLQYLKNLDCKDVYLRYKLDLLLEDLTHARHQCFLIIQLMRRLYFQNPDITKHVQNLSSINGIGFITSMCILAKIGDPALLTNQRQLASFIGITPREHSSGQSDYKGSITHIGDSYLRSLLIEASWRAIRQNTLLEKFFNRIKDRNDPKYAKRKAIVAVARKLTLFIYCVLKQQRPFMAH